MANAMDTVQRDVGALHVSVTPMGVMRKSKLLPKLGGIFAAALSKTDGINVEDDASRMAPALQAFCDKLDEMQVEALIKALTYGVSVSNEEIGNVDLVDEKKIDKAFQGDLFLMFSVLALSLEINFGDFIERGKAALLAKFTKRAKPEASASESPST